MRPLMAHANFADALFVIGQAIFIVALVALFEPFVRAIAKH